jgi:hypothetical protein
VGGVMDVKGEAKLDEVSLKEFLEVRERIANSFPDEAFDILKDKNPGLLDEMHKFENIIDSLINIPVKPTAIRKQWKETLAKYDETARLCITYAKRHMALKS